MDTLPDQAPNGKLIVVLNEGEDRTLPVSSHFTLTRAVLAAYEDAGYQMDFPTGEFGPHWHADEYSPAGGYFTDSVDPIGASFTWTVNLVEIG